MEHSDEQWSLQPHIPFLRKERMARQAHATTMARTIAVDTFKFLISFPVRFLRAARTGYSMPPYAEALSADEAFFFEKSGMGRNSWKSNAARTTTAAAVPSVNPPPWKKTPNWKTINATA